MRSFQLEWGGDGVAGWAHSSPSRVEVELRHQTEVITQLPIRRLAVRPAAERLGERVAEALGHADVVDAGVAPGSPCQWIVIAGGHWPEAHGRQRLLEYYPIPLRSVVMARSQVLIQVTGDTELVERESGAELLPVLELHL
jgi:hypothetical protein